MFLLLNPFLLYFGAAWGEIDAIVALLALAALALLYLRHRDGSALLLALAVCFKPTAAALRGGRPRLPRRQLAAAGGALRGRCVSAGWLLFYVVPFFVFGWSRAPFSQRLNAHFVRQGALSFMTVVRLFRDPLLMQGSGGCWACSGCPPWLSAWSRSRGGDGGFEDLLKKGTGLALIVFLTRSWLAETERRADPSRSRSS